MKKLLLTIALVPLILISCSKYDEGPAISLRAKKARLTGEWFLKTANGYDAYRGRNNPNSVSYGLIDIIWTFEKDGEFKGDVSLECYNGCSVAYFAYAKWSFEDKHKILKIDGYGDTIEGRGNGIPSGLDTENYTIIKLSNNEMILETTSNNPDVLSFEKVK